MAEILGIFGVDWRLLIVQMINFALLLGVLWYVLYRPIFRILNERQKKIEKGVQDADLAKNEVAKIESEKASILRDASLEAEKVLLEAKEHAKIRERALTEEAQEKSARIVAAAELRGEEMKQQALEESKVEMARLIVLGAEKILRK